MNKRTSPTITTTTTTKILDANDISILHQIRDIHVAPSALSIDSKLMSIICGKPTSNDKICITQPPTPHQAAVYSGIMHDLATVTNKYKTTSTYSYFKDGTHSEVYNTYDVGRLHSRHIWISLLLDYLSNDNNKELVSMVRTGCVRFLPAEDCKQILQ